MNNFNKSFIIYYFFINISLINSIFCSFILEKILDIFYTMI